MDPFVSFRSFSPAWPKHSSSNMMSVNGKLNPTVAEVFPCDKIKLNTPEIVSTEQRLTSYLDNSDAKSAHCANGSTVLQLPGCLSIHMDLLLLLGGSDPQEVLRKLPDIHLNIYIYIYKHSKIHNS